MNLIAIFMCSINILNAKLRTNYDKMKLVILLIAFHLTGQCSCLKKG